MTSRYGTDGNKPHGRELPVATTRRVMDDGKAKRGDAKSGGSQKSNTGGPTDTKQDNAQQDKDGDNFLSIDSDDEDMAVGIVADVFTGGIYGTVESVVDCVDDYHQRRQKDEVAPPGGSIVDRHDVQLAAEVTANILTLGIYQDVKELIKEGFGKTSDEEEEESERKQNLEEEKTKQSKSFRKKTGNQQELGKHKKEETEK